MCVAAARDQALAGQQASQQHGAALEQQLRRLEAKFAELQRAADEQELRRGGEAAAEAAVQTDAEEAKGGGPEALELELRLEEAERAALTAQERREASQAVLEATERSLQAATRRCTELQQLADSQVS